MDLLELNSMESKFAASRRHHRPFHPGQDGPVLLLLWGADGIITSSLPSFDQINSSPASPSISGPRARSASEFLFLPHLRAALFSAVLILGPPSSLRHIQVLHLAHSPLWPLPSPQGCCCQLHRRPSSDADILRLFRIGRLVPLDHRRLEILPADPSSVGTVDVPASRVGPGSLGPALPHHGPALRTVGIAANVQHLSRLVLHFPSPDAATLLLFHGRRLSCPASAPTSARPAAGSAAA